MRLIFISLFLIFALAGFAQLEGKVVSIADGDTFTLLVNKKPIKIRLYGVDCPEKKQDFGNVAKDYLSGFIFSKTVSVKKVSRDRYGRTIGVVTVNGTNVNEALLQAGLAWHYKVYDKNPAWAHLETTARKAKKGLWIQSSPIPPWQFRKRR